MQNSVKRLEKWLAARAAVVGVQALSPLPTTRALGEKFGTSHSTAFRRLCQMESAGLVWRHPNGRFYPAAARRILGLSKPLAVALRRMKTWSSLCREVMEGFTEECGAREQSVLLVPCKPLVDEEAPGGAVRIASAEKQREMLEDLLLLHGKSIRGVLLDEVWTDAGLADALPSGLPAAVFYRPTRLAHLGNVGGDFRAGALLALGHLLACRYDQILLVNPLPHYEPATAFLRCAREVYAELTGKPFPRDNETALQRPAEKIALLKRLSTGRERCGLICPEDNNAQELAETMRRHGQPPGRRHGLLAVMGTRAAGTLTAVRYDFQAMGRRAAQMLCEGPITHQAMKPVLVQGETTAG